MPRIPSRQNAEQIARALAAVIDYAEALREAAGDTSAPSVLAAHAAALPAVPGKSRWQLRIDTGNAIIAEVELVNEPSSVALLDGKQFRRWVAEGRPLTFNLVRFLGDNATVTHWLDGQRQSVARTLLQLPDDRGVRFANGDPLDLRADNLWTTSRDIEAMRQRMAKARAARATAS